MSQEVDQTGVTRVEYWITRDRKPRAVIYGYFSPALAKRGKDNYDINPVIALFRLWPRKPLISLREIMDARGYRELFHTYRLPEIQRVDLSLSKAERVLFGNLSKQRTAYAYISYTPRHARAETPEITSARLASRKVKVRYGLRRERAPYQLGQLRVEDGSVLYVTMRCSLCGSTRRIKVTDRNQGRETPICSKCRKQVMFVAKIRKVSNH